VRILPKLIAEENDPLKVESLAAELLQLLSLGGEPPQSDDGKA
jgi:hypothetical protein